MDSIEKILEDKLYIAGPCSIESKEQILDIGKKVKALGANVLRGGAFKPRTSPDSFQGLGKEGIDYLVEVKKELDLPIVTEIVDINHLSYYEDVDIIQVGARNMQNFELLKALGKTDKWILLKRSFGCTVNEWLSAAEYIKAGGNDKIILCERGIRTFEDSTRFTFDVNAIAVVKDKSAYKIIVDPSHATGNSKYVESATYAGIASGADGFIIEIHDNPKESITDPDQAITPDTLEKIIKNSNKIKDIIEE